MNWIKFLKRMSVDKVVEFVVWLGKGDAAKKIKQEIKEETSGSQYENNENK